MIYLETDRLSIRNKHLDDFENECLMDMDEEVRRFTSGVADAESTLKYLRLNIERTKLTGLGYFAVTLKPSDAMIGWVCLKQCDLINHVELGYQLMKSHWSKGYATEAAYRLLQYGFRELSLPEIWAVVDPDNPASKRVVEKLGFVRMSRHPYDCRSGFVDAFRMLREEIKPT